MSKKLTINKLKKQCAKSSLHKRRRTHRRAVVAVVVAVAVAAVVVAAVAAVAVVTAVAAPPRPPARADGRETLFIDIVFVSLFGDPLFRHCLFSVFLRVYRPREASHLFSREISRRMPSESCLRMHF